ncbi:sugar phosphate isomerase/epimerase family protein [Aquipuribacter nitratireducens]|uniref:Sugar phosphate isomerase/epimerase family protein n=1 Tax=Aquipuribacter nitratireducens TaxID=650104 RepID=A0ABW0GME8_9MICO
MSGNRTRGATPDAATGGADLPFTLGYGTNGLADHRLPEALDVVAALGYGGVGLTLDHHHLDPFGDDLTRRTLAVRRALEVRGLRAVVETGGRYVLDPFRKHEPTLVGADGRSRRIELLRRAVRVAAGLGAPVVSFWSGVRPVGTTADVATDRLLRSLETLLPEAAAAGVVLSLEPEPGHHVATIGDALAVVDALGRPSALGLTVDVGHAVCNEPQDPAETLRLAGDLLANVQLDDMRPGVHEHLPFGEGDVDLADVLRTLVALGYTGMAAVELPRHSHAGPETARRSRAALDRALTDPAAGSRSVVDVRSGTGRLSEALR